MNSDANPLRDARLQKALEHAPDAQATPAVATRAAVKNMARMAVAAVAAGATQAIAKPVGPPVARPNTNGSSVRPVNVSMPWWKRLWADAGRLGAPWSAAFATVVMGVVITLAWQGQDVPNSVPDAVSERAARPAHGVAPSAPAAAQTVLEAPQIPPAQIRTQVPAPSAPSTSTSTSTRLPPSTAIAALESKPAQTPPPPAAAVAAPSRPQAENSAQRVAPDRAETSAMAAPAAQIAPLPSAIPSAEPTAAPAAAPAAATTAPPAPAVAAVPQVIAVPQAALAKSRLADSARRASAPTPTASVPDWAGGDLVYQGRSKTLQKPEAQGFASLLETLVATAAPASTDGPTGQPAMRLTLRTQHQAVRPDGELAAPVGTAGSRGALVVGEGASFELWGNTFRWRRAGVADVMGVASPQALAALQAELGRAMPP